eukprot:363440-Chlamydomonas_euryale.AAC.7
MHEPGQETRVVRMDARTGEGKREIGKLGSRPGSGPVQSRKAQVLDYCSHVRHRWNRPEQSLACCWFRSILSPADC